ncbi:MAG: hypothetical protein ACQERF_04765 [Actinomycetota bacterium]
MAEVLPISLEGVRIHDPGTVVHDLNGEPLFRRIPLVRNRRGLGYSDIAVNDIFGEPLLSISFHGRWNEAAILRAATAALRRTRRAAKYDTARFVAYSYPKLAIQFLLDGREVAMLELHSWIPVPPEGDRKADPYFSRWSLIKETPDGRRAEAAETFEKRIAHWDQPELRQIDPSLISRETLRPVEAVVTLREVHEVHYAPRQDDHHICYELRGQQTGVWCVAASVEMLLNFYRWRYDQPRIADELDLGTCTVPNGLPYGDEITVVNTLEQLTSNTLDATMHANPAWSIHRDEIRADRPLISFVPRHSRTVVGFTESRIALLGDLPYRGLLVYDPWPPTDCAHPESGGTITRWENFRTQTYRFAFTAQLQHV